MHELSIAMSLIETAQEQAEALDARGVRAIHLKVGPLSGVVVEALRSSYEIAREDTALADAELVIESTPVTARCPVCRMDRPVVSIQDVRCGVCGAPTPEIVTGRELEVTAMEIDE